MDRTVHYASTDSPHGPLWMAVGERGVVMVSGDTDEVAFCHDLELAGYDPEYDPERVAEVARELEEFFMGARTEFSVPIDLDRFPPFQRAVLKAVAEVPYGEVRSYGEIAEAVGCPRAARAVGTAMSRNRLSFLVPCHRIIRSDGTLGEYGGRVHGRSGAEFKRVLLEREGVYL